MNRKEKILRHIDKNGYGIEIGPCHSPIASKDDGYKVHVIDHLNREQLVDKYRDHEVNVSKIVDVDFVWQGESYSELTGKSKFYDWIIASHVVEHTPCLIGFFNNCDSILKDDGVISLVVPDKRYCFDHYRPITGISRVIDMYYQKSTNHTPGAVVEYFLNVVSQSGEISWSSNNTGKYKLIHSLGDALQGMNAVVNENAYLDVHAWCFVPHSFRLIIHDLFCLGLIPFQEVDFYPTVGCEFYITLGRRGQGPNKSRIEMLEAIESEIRHGTEIQAQPLQYFLSKSETLIKRLARRLM